MPQAARAITTADQLLDAGDIGRCELVRGQLRMTSLAGADHGAITAELTLQIANRVADHRLGRVYAAGTGFVIEREPDSVRAPNIGFVTKERVPRLGRRGFFEGAPDLAVEVLSPDDRAGEVLEKVQDWLNAGCRAVWIVDPRSRTVTVYHGSAGVRVLRDTDTLDGGELLPGFELPVAAIFDLD